MTYLTEVLADIPVHYWRLADPEGNVANDIGSGAPFPLWVVQGSGHPPCGFSGPNSDGGSAVFDAVNWLDSLVSVNFTPPVSIDWVLWVPGVRADAAQNFPWGWGDTGNGPFHNELASGVYALNFGAGASVPGAPPSAQRWHHFAFTYAAGAAAFSYYIDGVAQGAGASGAIGAFASRLQLGRRNAAGTQMVGPISEFAIYPAVLSAARVAAHSGALTSRIAPPVSKASGGYGSAVGGDLNSDAVLKAVTFKAF